MDDEEKIAHKKIKLMAKSLKLSYDDAKTIHEMTVSKGVVSKTLEDQIYDEALNLTPKIYGIVSSIAE